MSDYYSREYWEQSNHADPTQYKSFIFFENIAKKANLPRGIKVQLGVGYGYTLQKMKEHWGSDQVLGIDIHNLNNDASIFVGDIKEITVKFPCAYIENDIGNSASESGRLDRWAASKWSIDCLVPGGMFITSADHVIEFPVSDYALESNCSVTSMTEFDNELWAQYLNTTTPWKTQGYYIICKKDQA